MCVSFSSSGLFFRVAPMVFPKAAQTTEPLSLALEPQLLPTASGNTHSVLEKIP